MGDNILEDQAGKTRKRRAKAAAQRDTPKLIERRDVVFDEFTIDCHEGMSFKPGELALCFLGRNGSPVDVVVENQAKGVVAVGGGDDVLRRKIERVGVGKVRITSFCDLTDTAKAVLLRE
ncbi:MAG: hypothetical protein KDA52_18860 [Planctomycetaceae bacterium]|nr:hypothetical protein [Planctomycetaceae bacterium]